MSGSTRRREERATSLGLARLALARGWSLIPVRPDKRPAIATWKEFQKKRPTEAEFERWAAKEPAAWAVITGAVSDVVVIDFDGLDGCKTLEALGLDPHVRTGSGGFHVYAKHPGVTVATLNGKSKLALGARWPGLDIRGDGGYAVFCGRNTHGTYEWLHQFPPELVSINSLPTQLRNILLPVQSPCRNVGSEDDRLVTEVSRLVTAATKRLSEQGRNGAGFWLACQLRDAGVSAAEAEMHMRSYCDQAPSVNAKGQSERYSWSEAAASLKQAYSRVRRDAISRSAPADESRPTTVEATVPEAQANVSEIPAGFELTAAGLFKTHEDRPKDWICAPLHVVAWARTEDKKEWGKLLRFEDPERSPHEWVMPQALLAKDMTEIRGTLLGLGLQLSAEKSTQEWFRQYLMKTIPRSYAVTVDRIGWRGKTFVLPDQNVGEDDGNMILFRPSWEMRHYLRTSGSIHDWQQEVGRCCAGNSRLLFCLACAAAAPLLHFLGEPSGGFHLVADTTVGKTTCLMVAGSFWGGGGQNGFVESWLTTANALENTAEWHNHVLLCLDELKLIDPEQAAKVAYSLSSGQSKGRMGRDTRANRRSEWRLLMLSSGELGLAHHLEATSQKRMYGGQEIRFCEIPARASETGGLFEYTHEFKTPKALSEHLKAASCAQYGEASREYLRYLAGLGEDEIRARVRRHRKHFADHFLPANLSPEEGRAGDRFALVAAGGELATELSIFRFPPGEFHVGVSKCFKAWRAQRGGTGAWDEDQAVKHVAAVLLAHGNSRFQLVEGFKHDESAAKIMNRIGFRTLAKNGDSEYLVLPQMLRELCGPFSEDLVRRALQKRGFLKTSDSSHATMKRTLPELGRVRCYSISSRIFAGDLDDAEA